MSATFKLPKGLDFDGSQAAWWGNDRDPSLGELCEVASEPDEDGHVAIRYFDDQSDNGCWFTPAKCVRPIGPVARELLRGAR